MKHDPIAETDQGAWPDPHAPGVIRLRQARRAGFRAVIGETPVILRVDQGRKVVRGAVMAEVAAGEVLLLPAGLALDVENHPAPDGPYRATALLIGPRIAAPTGPCERWQVRDSRIGEAFDRALDLQRRPLVPQSVRDHAVMEVLLWLDAAGIRLPPPGMPSFADRLRAHLAQDLARDWTAGALAKELATSEATLRRRLAREGSGLAELLADLRMNRALGLLQSTDRPVGVIALEVGYASPSRFARRFRQRFGLSPAQIRHG